MSLQCWCYMQMHSRMPSLIPWFYCQKKSFSWRKTWRHLEHFQTSVSTSDCSTIIMHCPRWQRVSSTRKRRRHLRQPASLLLAGRLTVSCFKTGIKPKPGTVQLQYVTHQHECVLVQFIGLVGFLPFERRGIPLPFYDLWFYDFILSTAETDQF